MTWTNRVRRLALSSTASHSFKDQEWIDSVNAERRAASLDKVSYETFEIVMDRLEKEWFDLVSPSGTTLGNTGLTMCGDEKFTKTRLGYAF